MKVNKEEWREMMGLADADERGLRGLAKREANIVDHPEHYNFGELEVIDIIEDWKLDFHCGNAIKYIGRHKHKGNPVGDIEKAIWYLQRYLETLDDNT
tara:strand:+ start:1303 stop:1596 length:294 start_codon:yes stop_codon:yes gene_type:complete